MRLTTAGAKSPGCRRCSTSAPSGLSPLNKGTISAARSPASIAASRRGLLARSGHLKCLTFGNRLAEPRLSSSDIELAEPSDDLLGEPGGLPEFKLADAFAEVENRPASSPGKLHSPIDDSLEDDP